MRRAEVTLQTLRLLRRSILWWSIGLAGLVVLLLAVYPSIRDNPAMKQMLSEYPEVLREFVSFGGAFDYISPAGYLGAELFSLMAPLLFIIAGITAGARAIAGEEEDGTLDLVLSMPVSRTSVLLQKALAVLVELVILAVVLVVVLWIGTAVVGMDIGVQYLAAGALDLVLLAMVFAMLALLLGAATGRRALSAGIAGAVAVLLYFVNGLAPLVDALDAIRPTSPFFQYAASDALHAGLSATHALILVAISVVLVAVAPIVLSRRDVRV